MAIGQSLIPHTETVNVWSHLIPCIIFIILEGVISYYLDRRYPKLILKDHVIFAFFLLCGSICLGVSALFHSLTCHSEKVRDLWLKLDFAGILLLILGCSISAIYMTFFCEPTFHYAYWGMIIAMSTTTMVFLLLPSFQGPRWRSSRVAAFIATSIAVLIPFVHAIALFGFSQAMEQSGMPYYFAEAVLLLAGVACYAKRWPESWLPGYFDILGNSHQIFHVLVVLAMALHLVGLLQAFDYNDRKGACRVA
ncbi:hemolysin-III family protein [Rutstroemia sp. NJR-2017a BBW]|nr:hemolysin-III family protein [Rutstroemia sp. NJR-2017a BBW]